MIELTRDYTTLQTMYTSLLSKKEDSKIAANLERRQIGEQFKLLDPARLPERPFSPNRQLINMGGIVAGLALGLALVGVARVPRPSFKTDDEVTGVLALPVLAVVPLMQSDRGAKEGVRRRDPRRGRPGIHGDGLSGRGRLHVRTLRHSCTRRSLAFANGRST